MLPFKFIYDSYKAGIGEKVYVSSYLYYLCGCDWSFQQTWREKWTYYGLD